MRVGWSSVVLPIPVLFDPTDAEMLTGRSPLSNLDQLLQDWRSAGGDRIRGEFEKAYAQTRG
jgi:hypothetical protein